MLDTVQDTVWDNLFAVSNLECDHNIEQKAKPDGVF